MAHFELLWTIWIPFELFCYMLEIIKFCRSISFLFGQIMLNVGEDSLVFLANTLLTYLYYLQIRWYFFFCNYGGILCKYVVFWQNKMVFWEIMVVFRANALIFWANTVRFWANKLVICANM